MFLHVSLHLTLSLPPPSPLSKKNALRVCIRFTLGISTHFWRHVMTCLGGQLAGQVRMRRRATTVGFLPSPSDTLVLEESLIEPSVPQRCTFTQELPAPLPL